MLLLHTFEVGDGSPNRGIPLLHRSREVHHSLRRDRRTVPYTTTARRHNNTQQNPLLITDIIHKHILSRNLLLYALKLHEIPNIRIKMTRRYSLFVQRVCEELVQMAESYKILDKEDISCWTCKRILVDPVASECGHTRCLRCVKKKPMCVCGREHGNKFSIDVTAQNFIAQVKSEFMRDVQDMGMREQVADQEISGSLGNSISQSHRADYVDRKWNRLKRDVVDYSSSTQVSLTVEDDKSAKPLMKHALYNATGPPGKAALLYSSGWPELHWPDGTVTILDTPIGEPTIKPTRLYTILVVRFADGDNTRDKITLEFSFKQLAGWWSAAGVEARRGRGPGLGLLPPVGAAAPSAVLGRAYHCPEPLIYSSENATLIFPDIMMQPFMENTQKFADAFDCFGFISGPICSGLLTTLISLIGLALSIYMLLNIQGLEHFENVRSKPLPITVSE